jgi:hypothetical protein
LQERLKRFEQDNTANPPPVEAEFRLDAGFGTYQNAALLIEMGYEIHTKPHNHQVVRHLKRSVGEQADWTRVGANAEMMAWHDLQLKHCPYPVDIALERFYSGKTLKHSALLHFGADPVTQDLPAWFELQRPTDHRSRDPRREASLLSASHQSSFGTSHLPPSVW